jgi:hypothetical protein
MVFVAVGFSPDAAEQQVHFKGRIANTDLDEDRESSRARPNKTGNCWEKE